MKIIDWARRLLRDFRNRADAPDVRVGPTLGEECRTWRQGDVFHDACTFVFDWQWQPHPIETVHGAVVISQSCDASLPGRDRIQIAPAVRMTNTNDIREAASGKRTQYVPLPRLGEDMYADLDGITTVAKNALLSSSRTASVETDQEVRDFAFFVARRFGRFAYPDEVVACFDPLTDTLQSKARKEQTPLGKALNQVHSFRLHCDDWSATPRDILLIVVMEPEVVPSDLEAVGAPPSDLVPPTRDKLGAQINNFAMYLDRDDCTTNERYFAWQFLADAWALQCQMTAQSKNLQAHVKSVTPDLVAVDDFPLSRYLKSHSLDLDYLSGSRMPLQ